MYYVIGNTSGNIVARFTERSDAVQWVENNNKLPRPYKGEHDINRSLDEGTEAALFKVISAKHYNPGIR